MAEGAFLSSLVDRLSTTALSGITSLWGVKEQVDSLIHELQAVECILKDADLREIRRHATSNNWLYSLRDAAYDAEDLIESVELHDGRYRTLNPLLQPLDSYRFAKQIGEIKSRFQSIIDSWAKNTFVLRELRDISSSSTLSSASDSLWRRSSFHLGDDVVVGRHNEVNLIIDRLLHCTAHHNVLGIVGMGGIGKTTLASLVYNKISEIQTRGTSLRPDSPKGTGSGTCAERHFHKSAQVLLSSNGKKIKVLADLTTRNQTTFQKNMVQSHGVKHMIAV
ncbi:hypothetical protein E2562_001419 [Oryza meyeriana var. granulata]|uniref:Rx N-terminal domain-containing protein n=1 Tax=Oryza meyeriana var. granulata TaxID=110450 RepID=A0A6G1DBR6_9ORYZ|nr:hypothetical protein E2562_001419 [Oryza meyeriana var. granulata]